MFFSKNREKRKLFLLGVGALCSVTGCTTKDEAPSPASPVSYLRQLKKQLPNNIYVEGALEKIREGGLPEASRLINISLQNFPKQPYLHIINGVVYERMADEGFDGKLELAGIAYQSAINLDPTNWYAVFFMGRLRLKNREYFEAQEYLAHALLLKPDDPMVLHDLAVASYYTRDLDLARASIQRALKLKSKETLFNRSAAVIFAATGEAQQSQYYFNNFKRTMDPADTDVGYVMARIQDWNAAHKRPGGGPSATPSSEMGQKSSEKKQEDKSKEASDHFVLDCYLLRVSDEANTSKGVNVLESFQGGVGLTLIPRTVVHSNVKTSTLGGVREGTLTRTYQGSISVDKINYNLNIANATDNHIEVLGRPTLSASLNKKASFSSGDLLKGGIQGTIGGSVGDIPTGTTLEVTPTNLDDDHVVIDISLEGSLLVVYNPDIALSNQLIEIAKTKVATTLRLKFGETGMLGGMYERTDQYKKTGFPLLQDIPGIQYLFSNSVTDSLRKSVLFLVTPRRIDDVRRQVTDHFTKSRKERQNQPNVQELLKQDGMAWNVNAVPPALITILQRMEDFYYQFRSGDLVSSNFWGTTPSAEEEIRQMQAFLYY